MRPKQVKVENKVSIVLMCPKCGYSEGISKEGRVRLSDEPVQTTSSIKVVGEEANTIKTMPTTTIECPKCHNMEAEWWFLQTRSGDEPPTQFYRCTKCGHTWRQYA